MAAIGARMGMGGEIGTGMVPLEITVPPQDGTFFVQPVDGYQNSMGPIGYVLAVELSGATTVPAIKVFSSIGEDFTFYRFMGTSELAICSLNLISNLNAAT